MDAEIASQAHQTPKIEEPQADDFTRKPEESGPHGGGVRDEVLAEATGGKI